MRANNVVFDNLRAEMGRKNIGIGDIAKAIGINRDTLARKLSGKSPLYLSEAFKIERALFPESDVRYLFAELEVGPTADRPA